jgi:hypothetical protein
VIVAANLNWPVASILQPDVGGFSASVSFDLAGFDEVFTRVHWPALYPQIPQIKKISQQEHQGGAVTECGDSTREQTSHRSFACLLLLLTGFESVKSA